MEHTGNKTENTKATALITAVHRERYEILVEQETSDTKLNARLKTGVYYQDKGGRHFRQWVTGCVFRQTGAGMH